MKIIDRVGPPLAAVVGGFIAGFAILESTPNDTSVLEESGGIWIHTTLQWTGTLAAVTAVLVFAALRSRASSRATATAAAVGATVLALPAGVDVTTEQAMTLGGVGAGVLLGAVAFLACGVAPAIGLIAALLFTPAIEVLRPRADRWLLSLDPYYPPAVVPVPALLLTVALVVAVALRCAPPVAEPPDRRLLLVGAGLPALFLVVYTLVGSTAPETSRWTIGVVVAVAATLAAALWLTVSDAVLLMVGLAVAAAAVSNLGWFTSSHVAAVLVLGVVLLAAGVWAGRRRPLPIAGLAALALVTAAGLLPGDSFVAVTAYAVALPLAAGFAVGSCRPVRPEAVVTAGMLPFTLTLLSVYVPVAEPDFGWTAVWPPVLPQSGLHVANEEPVPVVVAVAVVLVATAMGAMVRRRAPVRS